MSFLGGSCVSIKGVKIVRDTLRESLRETNSSHLKMDGWNRIVSFWGTAYFQVRTVSFREGTLPETNIQGHYSRTPQSNPENRLTVYLPFSKHQRVINQWPLKIISWKIKFPCWALTMFHCELLALGRFVFYILGHMYINHTDIESFTFESDYNSVFHVCWEFCLFCLMHLNNTCTNMFNYTYIQLMYLCKHILQASET